MYREVWYIAKVLRYHQCFHGISSIHPIRKCWWIFWFGLEKISKNRKLSKIHRKVFEHIPNASAVQFWASNSSSVTFGHAKHPKILDFYWFCSKVDFFREGLHMMNRDNACALPPRISIKGHIGIFPYSFFDVSQCSKRRLAIHFERTPPLRGSNTGGSAITNTQKWAKLSQLRSDLTSRVFGVAASHSAREPAAWVPWRA